MWSSNFVIVARTSLVLKCAGLSKNQQGDKTYTQGIFDTQALTLLTAMTEAGGEVAPDCGKLSCIHCSLHWHVLTLMCLIAYDDVYPNVLQLCKLVHSIYKAGSPCTRLVIMLISRLL